MSIPWAATINGLILWSRQPHYWVLELAGETIKWQVEGAMRTNSLLLVSLWVLLSPWKWRQVSLTGTESMTTDSTAL
jgi:hypothetical protein